MIISKTKDNDDYTCARLIIDRTKPVIGIFGLNYHAFSLQQLKVPCSVIIASKTNTNIEGLIMFPILKVGDENEALPISHDDTVIYYAVVSSSWTSLN